MLMTTRSSGELASKIFIAGNKEFVESGSSRTDERVKNSSKSKTLKNEKFEIQACIGAIRESTFLTFGAKKVFNRLRQAFVKAPIPQHFDLKCHIWIEVNVSGYIIGEVFS